MVEDHQNQTHHPPLRLAAQNSMNGENPDVGGRSVMTSIKLSPVPDFGVLLEEQNQQEHGAAE